MRDKLSFHNRSSGAAMSRALALEMQRIAFDAAAPVDPGATVKAQLARAWSELGRPRWWRLKAAWYGEAGCWSGEAIEEFRERDRARRQREATLREQAFALGELLAAAATEIDAHGHRRGAAYVQRVAGELGSANSAVAAAKTEAGR